MEYLYRYEINLMGLFFPQVEESWLDERNWKSVKTRLITVKQVFHLRKESQKSGLIEGKHFRFTPVFEENNDETVAS